MARSKKPHWKTRADDYRQLATRAKNPEVRQILEHLERVCTELAKIEAADSDTAKAASWMDRFTQTREETAERWRQREIEYLAIADKCSSPEGQQSWRMVGGRCAEVAGYLETMADRRDRAPRKSTAAD